MWKITRKIAARVGAIGLLVCVAPAMGVARGGGGAAHVGGGPHFGGGHLGGFAPHFHAGPAFVHVHAGGPQFHHFNGAAGHFAVGPGGHFAVGPHGHVFVNAHAFAARRAFVASGAFRPFVIGGWRGHRHLGWIGPLFWPYAYGDFFYYSLWPDQYDYIDPFWAYGYGDIYQGIFSPYSYEGYVQGPHAQSRMTALTEQMTQSCAQEAAEVTGWPIDQIHDAVQPDAQQNALLDDLGNAVVKASESIKSHCPTTVSFTPTGRLAEMQQRLGALVDAVNIVEPPLSKFYDSLSDEQKARFNAMGANAMGAPGRQGTAKPQTANVTDPQAGCGGPVMNWPSDQIDRVVKPTDAQRPKLEALQAAAAQAADTIKAACPTDIPSTPPARLEAVGKRLSAMLQAVQTIEPALTDFYNALSDDQKARFNTLGRQLFAANRT
jgi:hypothetical protein